jgi:hypothetical protein
MTAAALWWPWPRRLISGRIVRKQVRSGSHHLLGVPHTADWMQGWRPIETTRYTSSARPAVQQPPTRRPRLSHRWKEDGASDRAINHLE